MSRLKITLEYDGAAFSGWAVQPQKLTVQGELERAFKVFLKAEAKKLNFTEEEVVTFFKKLHIQGSGRTDSGVHARAQVAHLDLPVALSEQLLSQTELNRLRASINGISRKELQLSSAELIDSSFDARRSPHAKTYSYSLLLRDHAEVLEKQHFVPCSRKINIKTLIAASKILAGTHDFKCFQASDCNYSSTERTLISSEFVRLDNERLVYFVKGKGFLKNMIRIIVGTLLEISSNEDIKTEKEAAECLQGILDSRDRRKAGKTMPAKALTLERVEYV